MSKRRNVLRVVDIGILPKDTMLKVKTRFSIYWVVVVDPAKKEVAVSNNSKSVRNGPDMFVLDGAAERHPFSLLKAGHIMTGASMALSYKKPRSPKELHLDTSMIEAISLVANTIKAKHIVKKATAALAGQ